MKKTVKYLLIVTSIALVVINIYVIINAEQLLSDDVTLFKKIVPEILLKRRLELFAKGGVRSICVGAGFAIVTSILSIYMIAKNQINSRIKIDFLMFLTLFSFFVSRNVYAIILLLINLILLFFTRKRVIFENEEYIGEIPKINRLKPTIKEIICSIILVIIYFVFYLYQVGFPESEIGRKIYIIIAIIVTFIWAIFSFKRVLIRDSKLLFKNFKEYGNCILKIVKKYILFIVITAVIAITLTNQATSVNQEGLEKMPLLKVFILAVFFAPVVEESIFRGTLRYFVKNKIAFIIISGIIFGFLHVLSEANLVNAILIASQYVVVGCMLAHLYVKTNNLAVNMFLHMLINFLGVIMMAMFS